MTMTDRSTVVGVFELRSEADAAIYELQRAGFRDEQIGFIVRNEDTGAATTVEDGNTAEAAPGAAVGAVSGGIIGGVIGAAAALLIPGIGPAIAGGILVTVLGGAAIGAAAGGIVGALVGMGVPEEEAHYYAGEFHSGRTLVTVRADGRQQEAINILHHNGGYDAGTRLGQVQQTQAPTYTQADQDQVTVGRPTRDPGTYNPNTQAAPIPKRTIGMSALTHWLKMVLKIAHLSVRLGLLSLAHSSLVLMTIQTITFRTFRENQVVVN